MWTIFHREVNAFLHSLIAYIVMGVFLLSTWLIVWIFPNTNLMAYGYADLSVFFDFVPYLFLLLVPAITMRSFSEEYKIGTLVLLLIAPIRCWEIVIGKYLACLSLVGLCLLLVLPYGVSLYYMASPTGNIDMAGLVGAYLGVFLLGGVLCALGMLGSALSKNQVTAFLSATFLSAMLYEGIPVLATLYDASSEPLLLEQLGIAYHYESLNKGLINTNELAYFFTMISVILCLLTMQVQKKRR